MSQWRFLGLERPRRKGRFRLRDRMLSSLGLALGIMFLIISWGLIQPAEDLISKKVLGGLPDRVRVSSGSLSLGPLALKGDLSENAVGQVAKIPNVEEVFRQAHFPEPCQLRARYAGQGIVTDLVLEMCDAGQVLGDIESGYEFVDPGPGRDIPAVVPRAILDLVNSGISVNTDLPQLSRDALIGKHFTLHLGTSSFRPGNSRQVSCVIVGVSDQIGAGGPAIPYESGIRLTDEAPKLHSLTLKMSSPGASASVVQAVEKLGLRAPSLAIAQQVESIAGLLRLLGLLLPGAILIVTALGLTSVLELQVAREKHQIALYRALGASARQSSGLYLLRAFSVALVGFVVGSAAGWIGGRILATFLESKIPSDLLQGSTLFSPSLGSFAWSFLFCLILTVGAGWVPARQAAKIEPAQVFREPG